MKMDEKRAIELTYKVWQYIHDNIEDLLEEIERSVDDYVSVTTVKKKVLRNIDISLDELNTLISNFYCPCCVVWRKALENGEGVDCTGCAGMDLWEGDPAVGAPCEGGYGPYALFYEHLQYYCMYEGSSSPMKKYAGIIADYFKKLMEEGK
jgi:hypothetical protein